MDISHRASDQQSLLRTQAGIAALLERPALVDAVMATLDHWDQVAPVASKPLRDEWRDIIGEGQWQRALDPGDWGQQLRQPSPLGKALNPTQRLRIIQACKGRSSNT